jgi:SAM-dependent methyltransferase
MVDSNDLNNLSHSFDIITAIEVLEHVENVNQTLKFIHSLLKPGGLFFYTTGNARPFRKRLLTWSYVAPEIHISFYEPKSLELALHTSDFSCKYSKFLPGFTDIIRSRTLKNFKIRRRNWIEKILPWPLLSRVINKLYQITAHPIAWAKSTK